MNDKQSVGHIRGQVVLECLCPRYHLVELFMELHHALVPVGGVRQASELGDVNNERNAALVRGHRNGVALDVDRGQAVEARAGRRRALGSATGHRDAAGARDERQVVAGEPGGERRARDELPGQEAAAAGAAGGVVRRAVRAQARREGVLWCGGGLSGHKGEDQSAVGLERSAAVLRYEKTAHQGGVAGAVHLLGVGDEAESGHRGQSHHRGQISDAQAQPHKQCRGDLR